MRPRPHRFHRWFPSQKYNISPKIYTQKYNFSRKLYNRFKIQGFMGKENRMKGKERLRFFLPFYSFTFLLFKKTDLWKKKTDLTTI